MGRDRSLRDMESPGTAQFSFPKVPLKIKETRDSLGDFQMSNGYLFEHNKYQV